MNPLLHELMNKCRSVIVLILCYAMKTLRNCSITMHIHDEVVIEASPKVSLDAICEQMSRTPPWAEGLLLRADGYVTDFYKKD